MNEYHESIKLDTKICLDKTLTQKQPQAAANIRPTKPKGD